MNKVLADMLSMYVNTRQNDWDQFIPFVLFAYRTSQHSTTKETPFYLLYGRHPRLPIDEALLSEENPYLVDQKEYNVKFIERISSAWKLAEQNIKIGQEKQKEYYDKKVKERTWAVDDLVMVYKPVTKVGWTAKLTHFWHGPFKIVALNLPNLLVQPADKPKAEQEKIHINRVKMYQPNVEVEDEESELKTEEEVAVNNAVEPGIILPDTEPNLEEELEEVELENLLDQPAGSTKRTSRKQVNLTMCRLVLQLFVMYWAAQATVGQTSVNLVTVAITLVPTLFIGINAARMPLPKIEPLYSKGLLEKADGVEQLQLEFLSTCPTFQYWLNQLKPLDACSRRLYENPVQRVLETNDFAVKRIVGSLFVSIDYGWKFMDELQRAESEKHFGFSVCRLVDHIVNRMILLDDLCLRRAVDNRYYEQSLIDRSSLNACNFLLTTATNISQACIKERNRLLAENVVLQSNVLQQQYRYKECMRQHQDQFAMAKNYADLAEEAADLCYDLAKCETQLGHQRFLDQVEGSGTY